MKITCPARQIPIPSEQFNVATDVAVNSTRSGRSVLVPFIFDCSEESRSRELVQASFVQGLYR